jgi:hypothetical protein
MLAGETKQKSPSRYIGQVHASLLAMAKKHNRKRVLCQQLRAVGEGFPNRVSEYLLGKNRWRFK